MVRIPFHCVPAPTLILQLPPTLKSSCSIEPWLTAWHPQSSPTGLPSDWEVRHSNSKNLPYYFNATTKESRWDPPAGTDTEKLKGYMAQHHSQGLAPSTSTKTEGKIRAAHLLVKHRDSRRPSSWRESTITRSKQEAVDVLKAHEEKIRGGQTTLAELATTESDCSSARKGGDLYAPAGMGEMGGAAC